MRAGMALRHFEKVVKIQSEPAKIQLVENELKKFCQKAGICHDDFENFVIATTEIVNNAIRHGNKDDNQKKVVVKFVLTGKRMKVIVCDEGKGFNPERIADPLKPSNIYKESGRGIFIVKSLMDDIKFKFSPNGTRAIFSKKVQFENCEKNKKVHR